LAEGNLMLMRGRGSLWTIIALCSLGIFTCDKPHDPIVREGDLSGYVRIISSYTPIPGTVVTCAGQTCVVGNSGIYQFWGVPQGLHTLKAVKPGFSPHEIDLYVERNSSYNIYMTRVIVYGNLTGYVYLNGTTQPVPGVTVTCAGISDTTGADGWYVLDSAISGTHTLIAHKDHYLMYRAAVSIAGDTTINIYMASSTISGFVTHHVDGPVAGARIEVEQVVGYSGSDGHYRVSNVPQGTHIVKCTHEIYSTFSDTVKISGEEKRFDIILTKSDMTGYVTHRVDGPVAGARIEVEQVVGYSGSDGYYIMSNVPQGTQTVMCTHEIYNTFSDTVEISGEEKRFDIVLTKSERDTLMVTDDAGVGMAAFEDCGDCPEWMTATDNRGQDSLLRLEYFMRSSAGPPSTAYVGRKRFYVALPAMPVDLSPADLYRATLYLKPAGQSGEPGYITVRQIVSSLSAWDEDALTWDNAPSASVLALATAIVPQGELWLVDVTLVYRDVTTPEPGVRIQMEETGRADPKEYFYFWSSEAPASEDCPYVVLETNAY